MLAQQVGVKGKPLQVCQTSVLFVDAVEGCTGLNNHYAIHFSTCADAGQFADTHQDTALAQAIESLTSCLLGHRRRYGSPPQSTNAASDSGKLKTHQRDGQT